MQDYQSLDISMTMIGIGKQVREAREEIGISQAELAKRTGLSQQAIAEIEAGRTRTTSKIVQLAKALGKAPEWLENSSVAQTNDVARDFVDAPHTGGIVELAGQEFARIPVFDIRFAAGPGAQNGDETPIAWHMIGISVLRAFTDAPVAQVAIFQADGDSMEPRIHKGDWVLVDQRRTRLTNPGIYALVHEGDGLLKRASQHLETGAVTLVSDNPAYPPMTIKKPERLTVIGRVFLSITRH